MPSATSQAFPTARPRGWLMSVSTARTGVSWARPMPTIVSASSRACAGSFMKAPRPTLTSRTRASRPSASFLDMIEEEMRGIDSTVPVASRSAYRRRSAGTSVSDWPASTRPVRARMSRNSGGSRAVRKPGIVSSLSRVPPVWPRARPLIIGTATPQAATMGPRGMLTLSPTPPVECLSTLAAGTWEKSRVSPECSMASVHAASSSPSSPSLKMAISRADIW